MDQNPEINDDVRVGGWKVGGHPMGSIVALASIYEDAVGGPVIAIVFIHFNYA